MYKFSEYIIIEKEASYEDYLVGKEMINNQREDCLLFSLCSTLKRIVFLTMMNELFRSVEISDLLYAADETT